MYIELYCCVFHRTFFSVPIIANFLKKREVLLFIFTKKIRIVVLTNIQIKSKILTVIADVLEWQTSMIEGHVSVRSCGFKSHRPHSKTPLLIN